MRKSQGTSQTLVRSSSEVHAHAHTHKILNKQKGRQSEEGGFKEMKMNSIRCAKFVVHSIVFAAAAQRMSQLSLIIDCVKPFFNMHMHKCIIFSTHTSDDVALPRPLKHDVMHNQSPFVHPNTTGLWLHCSCRVFAPPTVRSLGRPLSSHASCLC